MKPQSTAPILLLICLALLSSCSQHESVQASAAWVRLLPGDLPAAGYLQLHNNTDHAVVLTRASSSTWQQVMIHRSMQTHGQAHMQTPGPLQIAAHSALSFAPGGLHLMLMQATRRLQVGEKVQITLHFADGHTLPVVFTLRPATG